MRRIRFAGALAGAALLAAGFGGALAVAAPFEAAAQPGQRALRARWRRWRVDGASGRQLGRRRRRRVFVASRCGGHVVRPRRIVVSCGDGGVLALDVRFRSYGGAVARGTAVFRVEGCRPDCASGRVRRVDGRLWLARPVRCGDGRLYYSTMRYRFPGPGGQGADAIAPAGCDRATGGVA